MDISTTRDESSSRSRVPAEVRRRLLDATTELVAARGLDGVNSNQIARTAGVGVGTFYGHFEDKHAAHQAVVADALETLQACIAAGAAAVDEPLAVQVRALVESVLSFAEQSPERFQVAFGREAAPGAARSAAGGGGRPVKGYSTRVAERRLGELRSQGLVEAALSPAVAARAFLAMQNGVVSWWLEDRARASREEVVETLVLLHPAIAARTGAG
ncbi:MAG: TetR/AcrR family transcriptional regulator [Deltaproteobacteria bacterium]|nr:TetR/AcrR family transcriptional regulator [Deltaproteobacteria bacterium]